MRALALVLAFAAAASAVRADVSPPAIRVDAVAEDRAGRAIDTLTAGDFEVLEDGTRRQIAAVTFVRANGAPAPGEAVRAIESTADEQSEAAKDGTRLFAIFLDEYHVAPGDGAAQARAVLTSLIERAFGPRDMVLVVKPLDSLLTLRLTRDLDVVRRSIAQFEGRSGVYEPRSPLEASITAGSRERADAMRVQVATSALNAIAAHLGRLSVARKALIVVSEGFPAPTRRRGDGALPTLDSVIRAANRGAVSISILDPRALSGDAPRPVETHGPGGRRPRHALDARRRNRRRRDADCRGRQAGDRSHRPRHERALPADAVARPTPRTADGFTRSTSAFASQASRSARARGTGRSRPRSSLGPRSPRATRRRRHRPCRGVRAR